jgi:hypothetical protein
MPGMRIVTSTFAIGKTTPEMRQFDNPGTPPLKMQSIIQVVQSSTVVPTSFLDPVLGPLCDDFLASEKADVDRVELIVWTTVRVTQGLRDLVAGRARVPFVHLLQELGPSDLVVEAQLSGVVDVTLVSLLGWLVCPNRAVGAAPVTRGDRLTEERRLEVAVNGSVVPVEHTLEDLGLLAAHENESKGVVTLGLGRAEEENAGGKVGSDVAVGLRVVSVGFLQYVRCNLPGYAAAAAA